MADTIDEFAKDREVIAAEEKSPWYLDVAISDGGKSLGQYLPRARQRWPIALSEIDRLRAALAAAEAERDKYKTYAVELANECRAKERQRDEAIAERDAANQVITVLETHGGELVAERDAARAEVALLKADNTRLLSNGGYGGCSADAPEQMWISGWEHGGSDAWIHLYRACVTHESSLTRLSKRIAEDGLTPPVLYMRKDIADAAAEAAKATNPLLPLPPKEQAWVLNYLTHQSPDFHQLNGVAKRPRQLFDCLD